MWDIFKNCHITSSRIQWKGKGQQIMKYLLHTLDIYYRLVIGRYHYRWDPSCSWRKPANFPESGFSWMKFRRHMHFYVTLWHANHCGRSVPFRSTHSHWQSTDTSPLKEVKWDMFIMKHYAIITYSMIKQSLLSRSVKQTKISWFIYYINTHFVNLVCLRNALTVFACGYSQYGTSPSEVSRNGS